MKNLMTISLAFVLMCMISCGESNPDPQNATEVEERSSQTLETGGKPSDDLKANAIPEGDAVGRATWSLGRVRQELNASAGKVEGLGEVTILLDENMLMVLKNEFDGNVYEKRVLLSNLQHDAKKMEFVVDNGKDSPNPGVRIPVEEGKAPVELYKNGTKTGSKEYLELLLAERRQVQLVVSAMTQAIKVSKGDLSL